MIGEQRATSTTSQRYESYVAGLSIQQRHIIQSFLLIPTNILIAHSWLLGQYALRQNYVRVAHFPIAHNGCELYRTIAPNGDFKGVWDGFGKDSTHLIRKFEASEYAKVMEKNVGGDSVIFSARTPYVVFDECRMRMQKPKVVSAAEKRTYTVYARMFRYVTTSKQGTIAYTTANVGAWRTELAFSTAPTLK